MNFEKYICAFALIFSFGKSYSEIVKVENGYLSSCESMSKNGREFLEFQGIPFASPPVGKLRFRVSLIRILV